MLVKYFSYSEVVKRKRSSAELAKIEPGTKSILPCVRSYEKIGMGIRTQLEYFYPSFQLVFVSACPEQLQPVSLYAKTNVSGLFEVNEGSQSTRMKDSMAP
jgi:hypothetical protein